jgi:NAD(P)-dependent dehydrogenase (short-subunit alcohol dehydrogenase family)
MRFKGKVVIVTGSSSGIGKATALAFAREGAKIVVTGRDKRKCEQAAHEVVNAGGECIVFCADVSKAKEVSQLVRQTVKAFGRIDILVNNAGIYKGAPTDKMTEQLWDEVIDINLKGPFLLSKAVIPHLKPGAAIVNIASVLGEVGGAGDAAYCASKGGIILFTKALALELAPKNIRVNAIGPGPIKTPMLLTLPKNVQEEFRKLVPLGRFGESEEVAKAVLFLASGDASYVTGTTLFVDGGFLAQ